MGAKTLRTGPSAENQEAWFIALFACSLQRIRRAWKSSLHCLPL